MPEKRKRRWRSKKDELIKKSREAALAAVQIFNNPNITFKSESYTMLMVVAWTYLLHAYYRGNNIEYRYYKLKGTRRFFDKTKHGAIKHWELEKCINCRESPLDKDTSNNLKFMIGLRHEIEHQMTSRIDDILSARFQACCLNYNNYIKQLFSYDLGIDNHLAFSLQFSTIEAEQKELLEEHKEIPNNIQSYMTTFDDELSIEEYGSQRFAYRILFIPKVVSKKGQADRVIEFVRADDPAAKELNKKYAVIKETERKKYLPKHIVAMMKEEGFVKFSMYQHTLLWKKLDGKNPGKGYGCLVAGDKWHWYEKWVDIVRSHCKKHTELLT